MALNAQALVSVAELKDELKYSGTGENLNLERAINRATAWLESEIKEHLVTRGDVTEYHTVYNRRTTLRLSHSRTIAITSVHESTALPPVYDATTLLTASTDYQHVAELGELRRLKSGALYPWITGYRAIQVIHSYGYRKLDGTPTTAALIPDDLKKLCLIVAAGMFEGPHRARDESSADALGSATRFLGYLPPDQKDALDSYTRYEFDRTWEAA